MKAESSKILHTLSEIFCIDKGAKKAMLKVTRALEGRVKQTRHQNKRCIRARVGAHENQTGPVRSGFDSAASLKAIQ